MKNWILIVMMMGMAAGAHAQYEQTEEKGFKKENLFSGGSISLSFFNNTFLIGANPVFGYRLANWVDGGVVANFQWSSMRDYREIDDRLRQTIYGGGLFTRLYPLPFLFAQVQAEHNFIALNYTPRPNSAFYVKDSYKTSANSLLIGGGYTSGRDKYTNNPFFYLSLLFDVSGNTNSPYADSRGRSTPIIRAGFNIPLFQDKGF
jgi:hypothetical protein